MGPCMCGDIRCPSCGPAQGNSRCILCNAWADEGCEHYDEATGDYKREFQAQVDAAMKAEREAVDRMARDWEAERWMFAKPFLRLCAYDAWKLGAIFVRYDKTAQCVQCGENTERIYLAQEFWRGQKGGD